ncbi:sigma-70 family RNA polymerase sigma factor [Porphyrobacter sp. AAP82]|uniref:sigma-70 family RNA polymerase sigma factor n=1 Tax=Porphyrobacter sp. AAP82 TaxID=1248917 RepID=UPI000319862A|nr:sigma-70 family RNA polymerase sigma factor [Porphyrobacter sp. AAP82]
MPRPACKTAYGPPPQQQPQCFTTEMTASLPALRSFARSLCRQRDMAMADDLVQETMVRAWVSRHTFLPGSKFRPWLFTILRNQFYNAVRKQGRQVAWEPEAAERLLVQAPDQEERIHVADLEGALAQLPQRQREMLMLIAGAGLSYEEAAEVADCKLGTVKSRINRGRAAMRAIIASGEALPEA